MNDMLTAPREQDRSANTPHPAKRSHVRCAPRRSEKLAARPPVDLRLTIDKSVIPLLHAALQKDLRRPAHPLISGEAALHEEVSDFSECLLGGTLSAACDRIDSLRLAGRSLECIFLKLLAPTACHLRDLWSNDLCGFADVVFALCNLQSILRHYAQDFCAEAQALDSGSRILVVTPSSDGIDGMTPMFGLMLLSQFFRRDGWDAVIERDLACDHFRQTTGEWFDLVEVLAANDGQLDEIASGIRKIRRGSPNPALGIIVCGQIFSERPDYIALVGADLMASDPLTSLTQARSLVTRRAQNRRLS